MSYNVITAGDYLDGTFSSGFDTPCALVMWVLKTPTQWDSTEVQHAGVISATAAASVNSIGFRTDQADALGMTAINNADSQTSHEKTFTDGTYDNIWVCHVANYVADDDRDIYIYDSTSPGNNTTARAIDAGSLDYVCLGERHWSTAKPFDGLIAEFAVFSRALTTAEIDALQTGAGAGPAPNTVASDVCIGYWPLKTDQATHTDQSVAGTGPTLTVQGSASQSPSHPTIASAVVNTSIIVPTGPWR